MTKPQTIEDYLAQATSESRAALEKLRDQIRIVAPDAVECVSYAMPAFKWRGKLVAGFAGFKHHHSYFHCSATDLDELPPEFQRFVAGKGTFKFDYQETVPNALVEWLIAERKREIGTPK